MQSFARSGNCMTIRTTQNQHPPPPPPPPQPQPQQQQPQPQQQQPQPQQQQQPQPQPQQQQQQPQQQPQPQPQQQQQQQPQQQQQQHYQQNTKTCKSLSLPSINPGRNFHGETRKNFGTRQACGTTGTVGGSHGHALQSLAQCQGRMAKLEYNMEGAVSTYWRSKFCTSSSFMGFANCTYLHATYHVALNANT